VEAMERRGEACACESHHRAFFKHASATLFFYQSYLDSIFWISFFFS
jgi:hypothetical protein